MRMRQKSKSSKRKNLTGFTQPWFARASVVSNRKTKIACLTQNVPLIYSECTQAAFDRQVLRNLLHFVPQQENCYKVAPRSYHKKHGNTQALIPCGRHRHRSCSKKKKQKHRRQKIGYQTLWQHPPKVKQVKINWSCKIQWNKDNLRVEAKFIGKLIKCGHR